MATQTENLGLRKPDPEDLVNVTTDISDNMDILDAAIEGKAVAEHSHGGGEAEGAVEAHRTDTTDVHGISDTSTLALVGHEHAGVYAPAAAIDTHNADTTDVHGIPDTSLLVDNADLVSHNEDTTAVHGIANTALLITAADHASIDHDDIPGAGQIPVQDEPPADPDMHDLWVDSDEPAVSGGGGGAAIAYQPEAPDNPSEGDLWADSDETTPTQSGSTVRDFDQKTRTAGNVSTSSTSFVDIDTALDIVLTAAAGDWLEIGVNGLWSNQGVFGRMEAFTWVGGATVNGVSGASNGVPGWLGQASGFNTIGAPILYTVVAGDVSSGTVTLRFRYKVDSASSKTLHAEASAPFRTWAKNLGVPPA